jgi:endonuclease/exonuclease/phosphatase family metal-dependent hydrolase
MGDFTDAWTQVNPDNEGYTYPSWEPEFRADRILYREALLPIQCDVLGYSQDTDTLASDHCCLYIDFELL